jgi:hypothetical protein
MEATETKFAVSLRERAAAARQEQVASLASQERALREEQWQREQNARREQGQRLRAAMVRILGVDPGELDGPCAEHEGILFAPDGRNLGLWNRCTECGELQGRNGYIQHIRDLGYHLESYTGKVRCCECENAERLREDEARERQWDEEQAALHAPRQKAAAEPEVVRESTVEEKLLAALRQFVTELM